MSPDPLAEFRRAVSVRARQFPRQWEASKKLLEETAFPSTIARLRDAVRRKNLPASVKEILLRLLERRTPQRVQDLDGERLKFATGLPPAKALRALAVFFELVPTAATTWPVTHLSSEEAEEAVRHLKNPFDLLLHRTDAASVLEIGAGDLSFAEELVDLYGSELNQQHRPFIVHCLDRLDPRSQLGGPLHASPERLQKLHRKDGLSFSFFGNQDMLRLGDLDQQGLLAPRYTIATCWAPATPTFAYEPTRLSETFIRSELERTKGAFHRTCFGKEQALEVRHAGRALLFPPWKFEIIGPIALLSLLARRGFLCMLGSMDAQVFWELLAQLLEEPRYRPPDQPFDSTSLPKIFGEVYHVLAGLQIGESIDLAEVAPLRRHYLRSGSSHLMDDVGGHFRYVRISRGAIFPGIPASSTARKFASMTEEVPPWLVTLVPA
ncbi:MAG: hypothetical protein H8K07_21265 [Nitrospira sp.]|jgi:hypothetical protein|nr:hypothetical protein [Nitrospira sp.]MDI3465481.1 hypothetical protein [Nitrospira sp.]